MCQVSLTTLSRSTAMHYHGMSCSYYWFTAMQFCIFIWKSTVSLIDWILFERNVQATFVLCYRNLNRDTRNNIKNNYLIFVPNPEFCFYRMKITFVVILNTAKDTDKWWLLQWNLWLRRCSFHVFKTSGFLKPTPRSLKVCNCYLKSKNSFNWIGLSCSVQKAKKFRT